MLPLDPQPVRVVLIIPGGTAGGHGRELPTVFPGIGPGAVGQHVANGVTGNGLTIVTGQQIALGWITAGAVADTLLRNKHTDIIGRLLEAGAIPYFTIANMSDAK